MGKTNLYDSSSIPKLIFNACVPAVITTIIVTLYHIADTFFVGQTGNAMQVAAITLSGPVFSILSGIGTLIGSGGCAAIAMAFGKKDNEQIKKLSSFCFYSALAVGILLAIGITIGMPYILKILNVKPETNTYTKNYLQISVLGCPFLLFSSVFANVVRGEGAIKESLLANGIGSLAKIVLDPVLILIFNLGIIGAAIATIIGNMLSALYLISFILSKKSQLSVNIKYFSMKKNISLLILSLGLPTALGVAIQSIYGVVSNHVIGGYGDIAVAASGVSGKLGMMIAMVHIGICMGIQPALAYNYGAGNIPRLLKIVKGTVFTTIGAGFLMSSVSWLMRSKFLSAFLQNSEVIAYGEILIFAGIITGPIIGLCYLSTSILQATAKIKLATGNALLRQGIFSIPLLIIFSKWIGLTGIVIAGVIVDIVAATIGITICLLQLRGLKNH